MYQNLSAYQLILDLLKCCFTIHSQATQKAVSISMSSLAKIGCSSSPFQEMFSARTGPLVQVLSKSQTYSYQVVVIQCPNYDTDNLKTDTLTGSGDGFSIVVCQKLIFVLHRFVDWLCRYWLRHRHLHLLTLLFGRLNRTCNFNHSIEIRISFLL
jgi:hypothetical protein